LLRISGPPRPALPRGWRRWRLTRHALPGLLTRLTRLTRGRRSLPRLRRKRLTGGALPRLLAGSALRRPRPLAGSALRRPRRLAGWGRPGAPGLLPADGWPPALPSGCSGGLPLIWRTWGFEGGSRRVRGRRKGHDRRLVGGPVSVRRGRIGRRSGVPPPRGRHGGPGSGVTGQILASCLGHSRLSAVGRLRRIGFRIGLMDVHANSRQLMSLSISGSSMDRSLRQIQHHTHHPIPASPRSMAR